MTGREISLDAPSGPADRPPPLSRNRDFVLLWAGQVTSALGSQMTNVAYPLLVLAITGSPVMAGLVGTARALPQWILGLPAGYFADLWDRRTLMLTCDLVRFLALGSVVGGLLTGLLTYPWVLVVVVVEGCGSVLFSPAETGALRHVVPPAQLKSAAAQNEAGEYGALLAGPPLGGSLMALSQSLPFLADAISYLLSFVTVFLVRTKFRAAPVDRDGMGSMYRGVGDGLRWLSRQRFLRASMVMVAATNLIGNAMSVVLPVVGRELGASTTEIGMALTVSGIGGLLGSFVTAGIANRVPAAWVVLGFPWVWAVLLPVMLFTGNILAMAAVFGLMLAVAPLWNAVLATYRIVLVPDELLGRVGSSCRFIAQSVSPLGPLLAGVLLQYLGSADTLLIMTGWLVLVAIVGTVVPALRRPPVLPGEK
jgi:MFS family permease